MYYKEAVGAFVVFDVTRLSTFEAVTMWKSDLDNKVLLPNGKPIPAVLLANKVCAFFSEKLIIKYFVPLCLPLFLLFFSSLFLFFSFSLASQCDLASEGFLGNVSQLDDYCKEKGFAGWFETSAKENIGIDEAARCLVAKVSSREREREEEERRGRASN